MYLCAAVSMALENNVKDANNANRLIGVGPFTLGSMVVADVVCCEDARLRLSKEGYTSAPGNSCTVSILRTLTAAICDTQKKKALIAAQHTAGTNTSSRSPPSRSTPCSSKVPVTNRGLVGGLMVYGG